jgi:hypothetical protein
MLLLMLEDWTRDVRESPSNHSRTVREAVPGQIRYPLISPKVPLVVYSFPARKEIVHGGDNVLVNGAEPDGPWQAGHQVPPRRRRSGHPLIIHLTESKASTCRFHDLHAAV